MKTQIDQDIKTGSFRPVYLIYGSEGFLIRTYRDRLLKALVKKGDRMNFTSFKGRETEAGKLVDEAMALPFLSDRRVILAEDTGLFSKKCDPLAAYLKKGNPTTTLIFCEDEVKANLSAFKAVTRKGAAVKLDRPDEKDLSEWIVGKLYRAGLKIRTKAYELFLDRTSSSMDLMNNECDKLISYCLGKEEVTEEDIRAITTGEDKERIFDLTSAVASGDRRRVISFYRVMLEEKEDPIYIITMVERQFREILLVREMEEKGFDSKTIADTLHLPGPWAVGRDLRSSKDFSEEEIRSFLREAADTDERMKTGFIDPTVGLEALLFSFCR